MELKTKYQYTYFIYPFMIDEGNYDKYLLKLIKNKHCRLKIMEREKDMHLYSYFLPKVRQYLFPSFDFDKIKQEQLNQFKDQTKATILAQKTCTMFEYTLNHDIQGKMGEKNGIFFTIPKIEIICFQTGIGFITIKTIIEGEGKFSDVLNFNYKFRDIHSEFAALKDYENIRMQTNSLKEMEDLSNIIKEIAGNQKAAKEMNLEEERFLTYSYACIEQEDWNENKGFEELQNEFIKFSHILPSATQTNFEKIEAKAMQNLKYAKIGYTKQGVALFTSSINTENYTKLPFTFENEYLYTYILALYKKIYFKKMNLEFKTNKNFTQIREKLIGFTQDIWIQEVTNDIEGSKLYKEWETMLELPELYMAIKAKYDIIYKDRNIEKNTKMAYTIAGILIAILGIFVINTFSMYFK